MPKLVFYIMSTSHAQGIAHHCSSSSLLLYAASPSCILKHHMGMQERRLLHFPRLCHRFLILWKKMEQVLPYQLCGSFSAKSIFVHTFPVLYTVSGLTGASPPPHTPPPPPQMQEEQPGGCCRPFGKCRWPLECRRLGPAYHPSVYTP